MLDDILTAANISVYTDKDKILEIYDEINKLSMSSLFKNSIYATYDYSWAYKAMHVSEEQSYEMSFFEFAYRMFSKDTDDFWKGFTPFENHVYAAQIVFGMFTNFISENVEFAQFANIDVYAFIQAIADEALQHSVAFKYSEFMKHVKHDMSADISIIEYLKNINNSFYNCAFLNRASQGLELLQYFWYDTYIHINNL